ncbi:hypothetical protein SmJEL517_g02394 [Synchytrium microbalum]|uniref:Uncharacterized protein n=1 Tax=Synchytrium microbalum TaxID=1806994 RepID=A0A507CAK7_9FUNG|nr:uncharacterized protein SmJEL517_g02394 [Synchytrium microbalum]TPX35046.1 hypothetical protein SmJEL517_g02394 [Synchytrium microbalum]
MSLDKLPSRELRVLQGHGGPVHYIKFNKDGEYVLTACADKTVRLWNPLKGLCIKTYSGHGRDVFGICVSADNSRFASGSADKQVFLWDVGTGKPIRRFTGHHQRINCVDFNQDATVVVSGSYDATVRVWDCRAQTRLPVQVMEEAKDDIMSLQVSGHEIAVASVDGKLRVYDIRAGRVTADDIGQPVTSVCYSNDKNCLLISTLDSTVRLMDKDNGQVLNEYKGHLNKEYRVTSCLSHTDAYILSGSEDGRIVIWDLVDGSLVRILKGHDRVVSAIAYAPKMPVAVSGSIDGVVKVWTTPEVFASLGKS